jgi:hypothetical protein
MIATVGMPTGTSFSDRAVFSCVYPGVEISPRLATKAVSFRIDLITLPL